MLTNEIRQKVDRLWDKLWSGGIANPLTAMEQISYLLFLRRLDESDRKRVEDAEWLGQSYTSVFKRKEEYRWSSFRHLPGEEVLAHVRDKVFPFVKKLGREDEPFAKYMSDAVFLIPKASLLVEAIGIIDEIYAEIEREQAENSQTFHDTQGDLYEYLLSEIATAGKNGQFRTPRHIIQMICELVDPKLGEQVCDPACGTGGFLLGAYQHVLTQHTSPKLRHTDENGLKRGLIGDKLSDERQWEVLRKHSLFGFDFDTTMVRIGLMNLLLHGIDHPNLGYMDTLSKRFEERDQYDVVLANPPFKGSIDKGDINEDLKLKTTKTELLFVNRMINLLRIGGRAGVIVPDGVLFGSSRAHRDLRKMIVDECELQAVISLPAGVFKPYAGVSTGIMIFVKGGKTEHVWFYDMTSDGYSLDDKREKARENDVPDVVSRWEKRRATKDTDRKAKAFFVPAQVVRDENYDLSIIRYKEIEYVEIAHEPPHEILKKLRALEHEICADIEKLEDLLG
jgi:type I restriction enzyme M protein